MNERDEGLMTIKEVSDLLHTTPQSVRRWCRSGGMPHLKLFGQYRFRRDEIERWVGGLSRAASGEA